MDILKEIQECRLDNVDTIDEMGRTPLIVASAFGYKELVEMLLYYGADVNKTDLHCRTALMEASYSGHKEVVELLLDKGADVNRIDKYGRTVLTYALSRDHYEVAGLLERHMRKLEADKKGYDESVYLLREHIRQQSLLKVLVLLGEHIEKQKGG